GLKLVNGAAHAFIPAGPNDIRGPCPALNTLAYHGYLPRNGIVRPALSFIVGLNLGNDFAKFLVYQAFLMNDNPITNLISIGLKSPLTGPDPPKPAQGCYYIQFASHISHIGDTSMTRVDAHFGDQAVFNETLFQRL
ncbi:hypothetical protein M422DRAFT_107608, partial [Sphaerobolus stellatus SS14]